MEAELNHQIRTIPNPDQPSHIEGRPDADRGSGLLTTDLSQATLPAFKGRSRLSSLGYRMSLLGLTAATAASLCTGCGQFKDTPGTSKEKEFGRTVNSLSSMLAGLVAQKVSEDGSFSMTIEKPLFPDAKITGVTTKTSIVSKVELALSSARFNVAGQPGTMAGDVTKSGFNWGIKQTGTNTWKIERLGWKFNYTLALDVGNGQISGKLGMPGSVDWAIKGRYDTNGVVSMSVATGPLSPNFKISGTVQKPDR